MKKLALGALFSGLVACGGGDAPILIDAPNDGGSAACNPVAQTGCAATEKCTWIIDQLGDPSIGAPDIGHIGCAPTTANDVAPGGACVDAGDDGTCSVTVATFCRQDSECPSGETCNGAGPPAGANGFDNCEKGSICIARTCQTICDPQEVGVASGCDAQHECGSYSGLFEASGSTVAGACDALCDVMTQTLVTGGEACGSTEPDHPNRGCFLNAFFATGSCAPIRRDDSPNNVVGQPFHNDRVDGVLPLTNSAGDAFKNGCAPGFMAMYPESDTSMAFACTGICSPVQADSGTATGTDLGNVATVAKLPREPAPLAGNAQCLPLKKGGHGATPSPETCVFSYGLFLLSDGTIDPMLGAEGESIGFCFPFGLFQYEETDGTLVTFPNLKNLPPPSVATTGTFPDSPDDTADFIVSGFRVTTATRTAAGLFRKPQVPQKRAFRLSAEDKLPSMRR